MDLEERLAAAKSKIVKDFAEKTGLGLIDIKLSKESGDAVLGKFYLTGLETSEEVYDMLMARAAHDAQVGEDLSPRGKYNEVMDQAVENQISKDMIVIIDDCDPVIEAMTREIKVGDMVLMEYAKGIIETVKVETIEDGMVYATGEDGEDFCAPLDNCDKVPF